MSSNLPTITVVTPSFNHAEFLEDTLSSVLDQQYPCLQYIVIDGGSTDGTSAILERYAPYLAYVVSEPDNGQTHALIKGFSRAEGDILAWLNSDDLYEPGVLHEVAEYFMAHPEARFVYGDATLIDRAGNLIRRKKEIPYHSYIWLHDYNYIPQPSAFWRRDLYEEVGGLDQSFDLAMDADLWDRFAQVTKPHHVRRYWSRMRIYPEQKNQAFRDRSNAEDARIRLRHGIRSSGIRWTLEHRLAKGMRVAWKLATGCYGR